MFAVVELPDHTLAHLEFGVPVAPPRTDEEVLRGVVQDPAHRGDELWDVPMHLALPILQRFLAEYDDRPRVVAAVVWALGALVWDESVPWVDPYVDREHRAVRVAAVEALGRMGRFSSIPRVGNRLTDPDPDVRRAAIEAAGKFGVPALVIAAAQAARDDEVLQPVVWEGVARTRASLTGRSVPFIEALVAGSQWRDLHGWIGLHKRELLEMSRSPRYDDLARARMRAVLMIQRVRKVGLEALPHLRDDGLEAATLRELVVGFGRCRVGPAAGDIVPLLTHDDPAMQHAAVVALGRIGDPVALAPLAARWDAQHGLLRPWIREALRGVAGVVGHEALAAALARDEAPPPGRAVFLHDAALTHSRLPSAELSRALRDASPDARRDAVLLLALYGDADATAALVAHAAAEPDASVRALAERGVARRARRGAAPVGFVPLA